MLPPILACIALSGFVAVYALYRRYTRISIAHIPGPKPESFLLGNFSELFQSQAGEADFKWQAIFGDVVRIKAPLGEDRLLISDPKALQYIYQTSGYNFPKSKERKEISRLMAGRGIIWADGENHKRHRKVMLPGFGAPEIRSFLPLFLHYSGELSNKWKDIIGATTDQSSVLDLPSWFSRAALDAIGEAAFDYQFGAMEHADNPLSKAYFNLLADTLGSPTKGAIFVQAIAKYMPVWLLQGLTDHAPSARLAHARYTSQIANGVAKSLIDSKAEALVEGKGSRDVFSLLVKANASENAKTKLNDEEMISQMRTLILAGHETTANSLSWTLLELARHPEMQIRLRTEIRKVEQAVHARGDSAFTVTDFENMHYMSAVVKEALRFHPVSYNNFREAARDDVLPLSKPIITTYGEVINEIPIPKGMRIITSIAGYNRNKDIFGEDAHTFNPDRWLDRDNGKKGVTVGVYANLLTFAGGLRSCIGWRFALLELQAFLIEMVNNFEFELTEKATKIRREACLVMVPTIEGEVDKGAQLPMRVRVASRE